MLLWPRIEKWQSGVWREPPGVVTIEAATTQPNHIKTHADILVSSMNCKIRFLMCVEVCGAVRKPRAGYSWEEAGLETRGPQGARKHPPCRRSASMDRILEPMENTTMLVMLCVLQLQGANVPLCRVPRSCSGVKGYASTHMTKPSRPPRLSAKAPEAVTIISLGNTVYSVKLQNPAGPRIWDNDHCFPMNRPKWRPFLQVIEGGRPKQRLPVIWDTVRESENRWPAVRQSTA
jgi:hypothetical protein